jgi:pimeloyl-ACP methyl ester carboxylesterase
VLLDPVMFPGAAATTGEPSPMVAAALRRRPVFPDRAAALAAYRGRGAFATWPQEMLEDYVAAGLVDQPGGDVALACAPQWEASNYAAQGHDSWGALELYPGPVTVLAAEVGSTFHPPAAPALDVLAPRMTMERLAGATHFLPMEQPERVRQALEAALSR